VIALRLVVVEPRRACSPSAEKLLMVVKNARRHAVPRRSMIAAQKNASMIASVIGTIGLCATITLMRLC